MEQDKLQSDRRTQSQESTTQKTQSLIFVVPVLPSLPIENPFSICLGQRRRFGSYGADLVLSPPGHSDHKDNSLRGAHSQKRPQQEV
jgi:hypothetical protein